MIRGHTDTIILRQLIEKDSYGYEINKAVQEKTGNQYELKEATLYTAFRRLEQAGLILSYWAVSYTHLLSESDARHDAIVCLCDLSDAGVQRMASAV